MAPSSKHRESNVIFPDAFQSVHQRYQLLGELGSGRGGVVRLCYDRITGEQLACKSISKARLKRTSDVDALRREVEIMDSLSRLHHVVELVAVYEDTSDVHLILELCDGGDLFEEVESGGPLNEQEASVVFAQVLSAVARCHASGILHRDIKPENILLKGRVQLPQEVESDLYGSRESFAEGRREERKVFSLLDVKLADFGVATAVNSEGRAQGMAGSPFYVAPEVVLCSSYTCKADMWSLGILLYGLLSRELPFAGSARQADQVSVAIDSMSADVSFEGTAWDNVSGSAKRLILRLLDPNPAARPSARSLLKNSTWLHSHWHAATSGQLPFLAPLSNLHFFAGTPAKPSAVAAYAATSAEPSPSLSKRSRRRILTPVTLAEPVATVSAPLVNTTPAPHVASVDPSHILDCRNPHQRHQQQQEPGTPVWSLIDGKGASVDGDLVGKWEWMACAMSTSRSMPHIPCLLQTC